MPRLRNANVCCSAVENALKWLSPHFGDEEAWAAGPHPLVTYHKFPYLLSVTGHAEECQRALIWVKEHLLAEDGDFSVSPDGGKEGPVRARVRGKAWVVMAAQHTGRFDISRPAADFIASQQGMATGGVYDMDPAGNRKPFADVRTTACAGLVFLSVGMLKRARAAGRFLCRAMELQAEEKAFHVRMDSQSRPVRTFPRAEASQYTVARVRGRTQLSFLGIPIVFLGKLFLATGESEWMDSAVNYFTLAEGYSKEAWAGEDSGPVGWGAATLYAITRRRLYYDACERVTQEWIRIQRPDGSWLPRGKAVDEDGTIALTAEAALCLFESVREAQ